MTSRFLGTEVESRCSQVFDGILLLLFFPEGKILLKELDDRFGISEGFLINVINLLESIGESGFTEFTGLLVVVHNFIVEDGEVKSKPRDSMIWLTTLSLSHKVRMTISPPKRETFYLLVSRTKLAPRELPSGPSVLSSKTQSTPNLTKASRSTKPKLSKSCTINASQSLISSRINACKLPLLMRPKPSSTK